MGHRKSISVVLRVPVDGGTSPNATIAQITVDLRVVFPPDADRSVVHAHIQAVLREACDRLWGLSRP